MGYGDSKNLLRRTTSDKLLRDKAFNMAKNHRYDRYQRGLTAMVYKHFDKNSAFSSGAVKSGIMPKREEVKKPFLRKI